MCRSKAEGGRRCPGKRKSGSAEKVSPDTMGPLLEVMSEVDGSTFDDPSIVPVMGRGIPLLSEGTTTPGRTMTASLDKLGTSQNEGVKKALNTNNTTEVKMSTTPAMSLDFEELKDGTRKYKNKQGRLHREDGPAVIKVSKDGVVLSEEYYLNGKKHREDGPASIYYRENGSVEFEAWDRDGKLYRNPEDGPTLIDYYPNGNVARERWCWRYIDEKHRTDGPALIYYNEDGSVERKEWWRYDKKHRTDGPAVITYYLDGTVKSEEWYQDWELHREDGPATIYYRENGTLEFEAWYRDGELTREDGPASIYTLDGSVERKTYYFKGHALSSAEGLDEVVKKETTKN